MVLLAAVLALGAESLALAAPIALPQASCQATFAEKGSFVATIKERLDGFFTRYATIRSENYRELDGIFRKEVLLGLLEEIIASPQLLDEVARRSYAHSLGFNKIILLEDWKTHFFEPGMPDGKHGYDVRLHIWWPQPQARSASNVMAEGRHEHKWDFTSRLITGSFENQRYQTSALTDEQLEILKRFETRLAKLPKDVAQDIRERMDLLEIADLEGSSRMVALNGGVESLRQRANEPDLVKLLEMPRTEVELVRNVFLKFANQIRQLSGEEAYAAVGPVFFKLQNVETYDAGDLYFHPVELAHRLFVDPSEFASTFIIVGPPYPHQPGQFVRPGADRDDADVEHRRFFTASTLKVELERYLGEVRK